MVSGHLSLFRERVVASGYWANLCGFGPVLQAPAHPRYHLPLESQDHGPFAREMPHFRHETDICTLFNIGSRRHRVYGVASKL